MKNILLALLAIVALSCSHEQKIIHSGRESIKVLINGIATEWTISPQENPDRLNVYCSDKKNKVIFQTDLDTVSYSVRKNDTIRFQIILKSNDTANTEIVGFKDLPNNITDIDKTYWLSQIWSEIKYNFVNIDRIKFDPDSLYKSFIPLVLSTRNNFEYYKVLQKFAANFHDGHTEVVGNFYPWEDYFPVRLMDFDKKVYVTSLTKKPGQDSTWLGSELIEIEGIPTAQYLETNIFPYISASTEQNMWMQGVFKFHSDLKDHPFRGSIRKRDGSILKITLPRNGEATRTPNEQYWGPTEKYSRSIVELSWLENNIAFVKFNRFQPEDQAIKEFDKVAGELHKAKGLILDLRRNGGGSTGVAWHLQKYLTKGRQFLNFAWETRINDGVGKANGNWQEEYKSFYQNKAYRFEKPEIISVSDSIKRIKCPVVILIGRYTFSAAEDFLVNIFEVPGRPKLIGESTAGSTGSPLVISHIPGGGYARICTRRICYPISYERFENCGVKPDIEIKQSIEDYLNSKDVVLERAIAELEK